MNKVSVVIVTKNRSASLIHCLLSLSKQTQKINELILIDNNSTDNTKKAVDFFSKKSGLKIKYILEKRNGYPVIYNRGLLESTNHWVAFIDDDCVASKYWYEEILKTTYQSGVDVILGYSGTYFNENIFSLATFYFQDLWKRKYIFGKSISNYEILDNKNIIYNKDFLLKNKLSYDESRISFNLGAAEDCQLGLEIFKKGGKAIFNNRIKIFHKDPDNFGYYFKKYYFASASHKLFKKESKDNFLYYEKNLKFRNELFTFLISLNISIFKKIRLFFLIYSTVVFSYLLRIKFMFYGKKR
jgi:glycosyltransferase involved in cell wall biosynthesis